ncbi:nuclear transport factor 2 family protein [Amycolatopsis sp. K13G38]|uniref:Nuclear transport factor 2 family protein n=1 Tax=Amycolatopsis acididurans TaxID=2724524 RepID=A0ABX1JB54_9PSEU|nr:nuclear transport factor 2 family protein [Amycolatopsis acididurans]NKQ55805.1 nuclear transport factor 2 family protein [Amycolatopsis acididurans]
MDARLAEEVRMTLYRYARAVDDRELDTLAALATDDVELRRVDGLHTGREAFLRIYRDFFASEVDWSRHLVTNIEVEGDGDRASTRAYFEAAMTAGAASWLVFGEYRHELVRTGETWQFRRKTIDVQRKIDVVKA